MAMTAAAITRIRVGRKMNSQQSRVLKNLRARLSIDNEYQAGGTECTSPQIP
jgi:hypothetical protein